MMNAALVAGPVVLSAFGYITAVWLVQRINDRKKRAARRIRQASQSFFRQAIHS